MPNSTEALTSSDFEVKHRKAKVLFFDVETSSLTVKTWRTYQADAIRVVQTWQLLCWSAKWQDGRHITRTLADYPDYDPATNCDKALTTELAGLLEEADIIVAHNGDKFDIKKINTRMIIHGLPPAPQTKSVDTLKLARSRFAFHSNKLDTLGDLLGVGRKAQTGGYDLWEQCVAGDLKAWRKMARYCKQDVVLLEAVYNKLKSWAVNHPNVSVMNEIEDGCKVCGGTSLKRKGWSYERTGKAQRWCCNDCGHYQRGAFRKTTDIR